MNTLCELIFSLKQSEIRALKAQYSFRERNEQDKRGKLLDLILEKKSLSDESASRYIYNAKPGSSFSHLKNRLWEDVCNILALQPGIHETESIPARAQVSQLINVARVLKGRELYSQSFNLVQEALQLSLKNALVPELMLLKDFISSTFPEFWMRERNKVLSILADSVKREADRLRAMSIAELVSGGDRDTRHVAELEMIYRSNSCEQIKAIIHRSMINIHLHANDKEKLMQECIQLYSLALGSAADSGQRKRTAIVFSDITKAALHVGSYDSAIVFGKAGIEFIENDIMLEIESYTSLLIAFINTSSLEEARQTISTMEQLFGKTNQLEFKRLYFIFLKGWYHFTSREYKICMKLISQCPTLPKEKEIWHAGFYILELLCLYKTGMYFQIDYRNDAYRKFLIRHEQRNITMLNLVYKTFKAFIDNDYNSEAVIRFLDHAEHDISENERSVLMVCDMLAVLRKTFSASN